jgi:MFS superfamily sulfate permease-like transporter
VTNDRSAGETPPQLGNAGLAVIVFGYIATIGSYQGFLVAVCISGILQIIMGYLRLGSIAYYFPSSVIKGMLCGIGLMIIIKQIPHAVGYDNSVATDFEEFLDNGAIITLQETINNITTIAMIIYFISIAIYNGFIFESISSSSSNASSSNISPIHVLSAIKHNAMCVFTSLHFLANFSN